MPKIATVMERYEAAKPKFADLVGDLGLTSVQEYAESRGVSVFMMVLSLRYIEATTERFAERDMFKRASQVVRFPGDNDDPVFGRYCREAEAIGVDPATWCLARTGVMPERRPSGRRSDNFRDLMVTLAYSEEITKPGRGKTEAAEATGRRLGLPDGRNIVLKAQKRVRQRLGRMKFHKGENMVQAVLGAALSALRFYEGEIAAEKRAVSAKNFSSRHAVPVSAQAADPP